MLFREIADTSKRVASTRARLEKVERLAACLRGLGPGEVETGTGYLAGEPRQGRIGIGYAALRDVVLEGAAATPGLSVADVDAELARIADVSGRGAGAERLGLLCGLLLRATQEEQSFLRRLLVGELRQGALEGIMADAIARAAEVSATEVRRALMLSGDLGAVAKAALTRGAPGLSVFSMQLFRPVKPMLAQSADGVADALSRLGRAALEWKLDGARVQVHRQGEDVRVFTRRQNDVTAAVPELVEWVRALPVRAIVLDGEALVLRPDGRPQPFQVTMRRFGRRLEVERMRAELPLSGFYFDCLHLDGEDLIDRPGEERLAALRERLEPEQRVPRLVTETESEADAFLEEALGRGHEGVVAKSLDATYEAGRRGAGWLKVKRPHTLDLVVLAAEWGSGRRQGWLSNLHLGARDPDKGGFVMLGKTFKGMTDEMLAWQTRHLQEIALGREGHVVHVRPELVVEVAFDGVQASPHYPGGMALRFARVKRYRPDKGPEQADTVDAVRALHDPGST